MTDKECAMVGKYKGQEYSVFPKQCCDVPWHPKDWYIYIDYGDSSFQSGPYETAEEAMENAREDILYHQPPPKEPVYIPMDLHFEWIRHEKLDMLIPKLVGIWIKHYSWVKGGKTKGHFTVNVEIPFSKRAADSMESHTYELYGPLPSV